MPQWRASPVAWKRPWTQATWSRTPSITSPRLISSTHSSQRLSEVGGHPSLAATVMSAPVGTTKRHCCLALTTSSETETHSGAHMIFFFFFFLSAMSDKSDLCYYINIEDQIVFFSHLDNSKKASCSQTCVLYENRSEWRDCTTLQTKRNYSLQEERETYRRSQSCNNGTQRQIDV